MRLIWINIIAIVIAISSLVVERPSIQADFSGKASLTTFPMFQHEALRNDSQHHQEKNLQIAQSFMAIVVIADAPRVNESFIHYLPLYNLHRQKEYFLLI